MAEVVRGKLALDPVFGCRISLRCHDSGIIDEAINLGGDGLDLVDSRSDSRVVQKVEVQEGHLHIWVDGLDGLGHWSDLCLITGGKNKQLGFGSGQGGSHLRADAPVAGASNKVLFCQLVS